MNPLTREEAGVLFDLNRKLAANTYAAEIIICVPFVFLEDFAKTPRPEKLKLGAQNCFWEEKGAYTGEVSPTMLKNLDCEYVILGHSERRLSLGETDEIVNKKIKAALAAGLKIIFCVGENERDANENYLNFLKQQIKNGLDGLSVKELKNIVLAYEPVWAISSKNGAQADTAENLVKTAAFIKKVLADIFADAGREAQEMKIIYGGSVNKKNFNDLLSVSEISGLLIGGASLIHEELKNILENIN